AVRNRRAGPGQLCLRDGGRAAPVLRDCSGSPRTAGTAPVRLPTARQRWRICSYREVTAPAGAPAREGLRTARSSHTTTEENLWQLVSFRPSVPAEISAGQTGMAGSRWLR